MVTRDPYGISRAVRHWDGPGAGGERQARNWSGATAEEIAFCEACPFPDCLHDCHAKTRKGSGERARRVAECHGQGMTDKEISKAVGIAVSTVFYYREQMGLGPNKAGREEVIAHGKGD